MRLLLPGSARPPVHSRAPRPRIEPVLAKRGLELTAGKPIELDLCHSPRRYPFKECKPGFAKDPATGLCCRVYGTGDAAPAVEWQKK